MLPVRPTTRWIPIIGAGEETCLLFTGLKQISVVKEIRLQLVYATRCDEDEIENGEDTKLKVKGAVANHPKGESAE